MPESELKLDLPCPRCGTSNLPTAQRCRQCFHELPTGPTPGAGLFDWGRQVVACEACGQRNAFDAEVCLHCGADMPAEEEGEPLVAGTSLDDLAAEVGPARLRNAVRARRRGGAHANPSWLNLAWLLRLSSVLFLFWGVVDTSIWLTSTTKTLAPSDPAGLRYSVFAIYELVRDLCIVAGVWLLTMLNPRR